MSQEQRPTGSDRSDELGPPPEDARMPDGADLFFEAKRRSLRRAAIAVISAFFLSSFIFGVWIFWTPIERWIRGETTITGDHTFTYRPSDAELEGLEKVHGDLLPSWVIAEANIERWGEDHADDAFETLQDELSDDPNLVEILDETREIVRSGQAVERADRLDYLMRSWSNYLTERQEPFFVQGNVAVSSRNSFFYVKTYRVASDLRVAVGDDDHRSRIVRRLDSTNVRESYLGATSKGADGAVVVLDRLYEFALDDIWPLVDETPAELSDDLHGRFGPAVRAELVRALPEPDRDALVDALETWRAMHDVLDAVEARHDCGSSLVIRRPGHRGLATDTISQLERWASDDPLDLCPALTDDELTELRDLSGELREDEDLDRAMGALVAWLGEGISIHEARHVADDVRHNGLEDPLPCTVCNDRDGAPTRAELSAYLSSFAWGASPNTTYFQACVATSGRRGPHARAMRIIERGLDTTCADGPVDGLSERARQLEATWFGRTERIELPTDYPQVVNVKGLRL